MSPTTSIRRLRRAVPIRGLTRHRPPPPAGPPDLPGQPASRRGAADAPGVPAASADGEPADGWDAASAVELQRDALTPGDRVRLTGDLAGAAGPALRTLVTF